MRQPERGRVLRAQSRARMRCARRLVRARWQWRLVWLRADGTKRATAHYSMGAEAGLERMATMWAAQMVHECRYPEGGGSLLLQKRLRLR